MLPSCGISQICSSNSICEQMIMNGIKSALTSVAKSTVHCIKIINKVLPGYLYRTLLLKVHTYK